VSPVAYPALFLIAQAQFKADTNLQQVAVQVTDKLGRPVHGFSGRRLPLFGGDFGPQCAREIGGARSSKACATFLGICGGAKAGETAQSTLRRGSTRFRALCKLGM
jgi:hypothetical protein